VAGRGDDMMVELRSREAMAMFEGDHNVTGLSRRSGLHWGVAEGLRAVLPPLKPLFPPPPVPGLPLFDGWVLSLQA
jgi:hypothetical protein